MRIVSLKRAFLDILKDKKIVIIVMAICIILGIINSARTLGLKISEANAAVVEYEKEMEEYNTVLARYDENIATLKENYEVSKQQFKDIKDYCDNSIYMKLDANAIWTGEVQYACLGEVDTTRVMSALMTYYDSVEMRNAISERIGISEEYLKEILSYSSISNTLRFYFYYDSEEGANKLLDCIIFELEAVKPQIVAAQGEYTLTQESIDIGVRADTGVQNAQNTYRNSYKSYNTSVTDSKMAIEDKIMSREEYAKENMPDQAYPLSTKEKIIHFIRGLMVSVIIGVALLLVVGVFRVLFGTRIRDEECFRGLGIYPLLIDGMDKKQISVISEDIDLCCRKLKIGSVVLMGISEMDEDVPAMLKESLDSKGISLVSTEYLPDDSGFASVLEKGVPLILYVRKGVSKYKELNDALERLLRYDIEIIGGIFNTGILKKKA